MDMSDLIALFSVIATGTAALVSIIKADKRHMEQLNFERQSRKDQIEFERQSRKEQIDTERKAREEEIKRDQAREAIHRLNVPQLELILDIGTIIKKNNAILVEFLITVNNKGFIKQDIRKFNLRVRTINNDDELCLWQGHHSRVKFPHKVIDESVIPEKLKFIFIEPNVRQTLSYTTLLPGETDIVAAKAEFSYGQARKGSPGSKHTVERVFPVNGLQGISART